MKIKLNKENLREKIKEYREAEKGFFVVLKYLGALVLLMLVWGVIFKFTSVMKNLSKGIMEDAGFLADFNIAFEFIGRFPFYIMIILGLYMLYRVAQKEGLADIVGG